MENITISKIEYLNLLNIKEQYENIEELQNQLDSSLNNYKNGNFSQVR